MDNFTKMLGHLNEENSDKVFPGFMGITGKTGSKIINKCDRTHDVLGVGI